MHSSAGCSAILAFDLLSATLALGDPITLTNRLGFLLIAGGLVFVILADRPNSGGGS